VQASDGRTLVFAGHRWWQLEPWLPGRADFAARPSDSRLQAAVRSLARLHVAMASFQPGGADRTWFDSVPRALAPAVEERIDRLENWTEQNLTALWLRLEREPEPCAGFNEAARAIIAGFHRCATCVGAELRAASRFRVPAQPCLRDVWHDHILFIDDTVCGIIDPAAARTDTVAADISRLLGSLLGDDPRGWEVALAAYQSVRPLSSEERALVNVLDGSGTLLSGMTWLSRRFFFGNAGFERPDRVLERMQKIAKRLERLGPCAIHL
jgi:Ser/Thr protein kinase RdoA (MazF antagonist)